MPNLRFDEVNISVVCVKRVGWVVETKGKTEHTGPLGISTKPEFDFDSLSYRPQNAFSRIHEYAVCLAEQKAIPFVQRLRYFVGGEAESNKQKGKVEHKTVVVLQMYDR